MAIDGADKLAIYNGALRRLGSRELAALTENREPRRVLDGAWGSDGLVRNALERGEWNFALRSVEGAYSASIQPSFGFMRAFDKPDDFVRLASISSDEYFRHTLTDSEYVDEAGFWFTDQDVIFIRFVSDGGEYGFNSAAWPEAFRDYLECDLAWLTCERLTNATGKRDRLERDRMNALKAAKSHDAMAEGVKFLRSGSWVKARAGYRRGWSQ